MGRFWRGGGTVGRPSIHSMRTIWDGIQYQATAGCPWRMLPTDFPPFTTVQYHFYRWRDSGVLFAINDALVAAVGAAPRPSVMPLAATIDGQSGHLLALCAAASSAFVTPPCAADQATGSSRNFRTPASVGSEK